MMLVDSHCHLNFKDFSEDYPEVLRRARESGVGVMQTICTYMGEFETVHGIAASNDDIYCSVGVHPNHVHEAPLVTERELLAAAERPKVIGLGETGLDYHYTPENAALQQESFRTHIAISRETGLPVIVHTRDADDDTLAILNDENAKGSFPILIHCFTSSRRLAAEVVALGGYISLSGILTFKSAKDIQDTARDLPLDRILIETDAPYLAPVPFRGKRNEPSYVAHTCAFLAELKGISPDECAVATTDNFFRLFSKARRP